MSYHVWCMCVCLLQPQQNKLSIRALTLISFRDYIILKLNLSGISLGFPPSCSHLSSRVAFWCDFNHTQLFAIVDALRQYSQPHPPQIQQMLLVLQSVREATPTEEFFALQELVGQVVDNYFPMVTRAKTISERTSSGRWQGIGHGKYMVTVFLLIDQGGGAGLEGRRAGTEDMPTSQAQKIFHRRGSSLGTVDKDQLAALEGK